MAEPLASSFARVYRDYEGFDHRRTILGSLSPRVMLLLRDMSAMLERSLPHRHIPNSVRDKIDTNRTRPLADTRD